MNIFANSSRKTSLGSRLKTFGIAAGAISLLAGSALAADLPTRKGPPIAPVYVPPPFTWTGFYAGVNAGGGWASRNNNNNLGFPFVGAVPFGGSSIPFATSGNGGNQSGFIGGVQAGYNYQFGIGSGFVIGGETDIDWANINRNHSNNLLIGSFTLPQFPGTLFTPSNVATTSRNNNQYIGTVRLRAGYAWDRILVYATGGLAYGGVQQSEQCWLGAHGDHSVLRRLRRAGHGRCHQRNRRAGEYGLRHAGRPQLEHQDRLDDRWWLPIRLHPELDCQGRISL